MSINRFIDEWSLSVRAGYPLVFVFTLEEQRAIDLIRQSASKFGRTVVLPRIKGEIATPAELLRKSEEPGTVVVLDSVHRQLDDPEVIRALADTAEGCKDRTVAIISPWVEIPRELSRISTVVEMRLPNSEILRAQFLRAADEAGVLLEENALENWIRALRGLTENEAYRAVKKAFWACPDDLDGALSSVIRDKKSLLRKSRVLESIDVPLSMADIGGLDRLKNWLMERRAAFSEQAREFGLPSPRGVLLMGVQGCGKSLTAKAVAHHWRMPLCRLDLSAVFGESHPEAALAEALMTAEAMAPTVLWIDEIEKGFDPRAAGAVGIRLLGKLITWLQEKQQDIFVAATANRVENLPPELSRKGRFDEVFFVDLPDAAERRDILRIHLRKRNREPNVFDVDHLADRTDKFTGSELEQVILAGLYQAFSEGRELSDADLLWAARETVPLFEMYENDIKSLREWARKRARPASTDRRKADLWGK